MPYEDGLELAVLLAGLQICGRSTERTSDQRKRERRNAKPRHDGEQSNPGGSRLDRARQWVSEAEGAESSAVRLEAAAHFLDR